MIKSSEIILKKKDTVHLVNYLKMAKKKTLPSIKFASVENLKKTRFGFVKNDILRENIAINMQHIVFLLSLEAEYELPGAITYSTFKTIIIYTASIIEALIHYKLDELTNSGRVKEEDIMGCEEKYSNCNILYTISESEQVCGIKKITKAKNLSDDTNFIDLNRAAKRSGLFTDNLFEKAEKIRKARNKIHAYSLKEVDDKYSRKDINDIFALANKIIDRIEKF